MCSYAMYPNTWLYCPYMLFMLCQSHGCYAYSIDARCITEFFDMEL